MKIQTRDIAAQVKQLNAAYKAVLVYGPDEGLVRERADKISLQVVEDPKDPFRMSNLEPDQVKAEPALIADEAAAISMMGGRRVVRIDGAGENVTAGATAFLENPIGDGLVIITAGSLRPTSGLRKLFEKAKNAAAIACYEDNQSALQGLIFEVMRAHNLQIDPDAVGYLQQNLGSDRMISRGELEKLALYVGESTPDKMKMVTLDDARAAVGDSGSLTIDMIAEAITGGDLRNLDSAIFKSFNRGENPITIIYAVSRRLQRFHLVRGHMDQGVPVEQALKKLSPPVFPMQARDFKAHLAKWSSAALGRALEIITQAEQDCKTTGYPAESICARACLRIANAARR